MPDVFDVQLFADSSADEIEHQLHRLRNNALWQDATGDNLHPSNKMARRVMESLIAAKDQAMQAERFQAAALPADTDPADAKAMLDQYIADPKFRCAYRDQDHPQHKRISEIAEQLLTWAHPPASGDGALARLDEPASGQGFRNGGVIDGAAAASGPTIADRLADNEFRAAYVDAAHTGHADAVAEMTALHEAVTPALAAGEQGGE